MVEFLAQLSPCWDGDWRMTPVGIPSTALVQMKQIVDIFSAQQSEAIWVL
jgi:hypothetical protein